MKIFYTCSIVFSLGIIQGAEKGEDRPLFLVDQKTGNTILHQACETAAKTKNTNVILSLLTEHKKDGTLQEILSKKNTKELTPVDVSIQEQYYPSVQLFIENSGIPKIEFLWLGIKHNAIKIIQNLIVVNKSNLDMPDKNDFGNTAVHKAAMAKQEKTIKKLISAGCALQKLNTNNEYPITIALMNNDVEIFKLLCLRTPQFEPFIQFRQKELKLFEINTEFGKTALKPELLNCRDPQDHKLTVLHKAIEQQYPFNSKLMSPTEYAISNKMADYASIITKLCNIDGIDLTLTDDQNRTPLDLSLSKKISKEMNRIVEILMFKTPKSHISGQQLIAWAKGSFYLTGKILPCDEEIINFADEHGNTALHYAMWFLGRGSIETLIASGANPYKMNKRNILPENIIPLNTIFNREFFRSLLYIYKMAITLAYEDLKNENHEFIKDVDLSNPAKLPTYVLTELLKKLKQDPDTARSCLCSEQTMYVSRNRNQNAENHSFTCLCCHTEARNEQVIQHIDTNPIFVSKPCAKCKFPWLLWSA